MKNETVAQSPDGGVLGLGSNDVQAGNASWWATNPMTYNWKQDVAYKPLTQAWFDEIDSRFIRASRFFAHDDRPFGRVIPFDRLRGQRVLEIGCGMGLHTELLVKAGADVTAIDITLPALEGTAARLKLKGLHADLRQMDAESLEFPDKSFDFIWSWGVIHHSSKTGTVVRNMARVLSDEGQCRVMVYNRDGIGALYALVPYFAKGKFLRSSFDEVLWDRSDGFIARFYTHDQFEDLFQTFFSSVHSRTCGQEADALPLPRRIREWLLPKLSDDWLHRMQARWGSFIFLTAEEPLA